MKNILYIRNLMNQPTFIDKQKTVFKRKKILTKNATTAELHFKKVLDALCIRYMFQKGFIAGDNYVIADFYLPKPYKTVIEIDGGYHLSEKQKIRDFYKDRYLNERRIKVIRITNEQVMKIDLKNIVSGTHKNKHIADTLLALQGG